MKDAVVPFGKDEHLVAGLLQEPASPALPADRLSALGRAFTLQTVCRGQGEHQQGEHDMHPHGPGVVLRRMPQVPSGDLPSPSRLSAAAITPPFPRAQRVMRPSRRKRPSDIAVKIMT